MCCCETRDTIVAVCFIFQFRLISSIQHERRQGTKGFHHATAYQRSEGELCLATSSSEYSGIVSALAVAGQATSEPDSIMPDGA